MPKQDQVYSRVSPHIYLPGGRVVDVNLYNDDCNKAYVANVPWSLTLANAATLALTSAAAEFISGGQAQKFTSGTSASSEIHRYVWRPQGAHRIYTEYVFSVMDENPSNFAFYNSFRDSANWIRAKILHVYSTNVWSYQDSAGTQQPLLTRDTSESSSVPRWHRVLIGIDLDNLMYDTVVIDDQDFTPVVKGQLLRNTADATAPFLLDHSVEFTNTATPGVMNIDAVRAAFL